PPSEHNALYRRLAAVAQPGYVDDRSPLHPARAVALLREALPRDGLLAADAGPAGLWVARTFATTDLGSVVVPASAADGAAAALATVADTRGRPAIAVTTAPVDDVTRALLERGGRWRVCVWGVDGARTVDDARAALDSDRRVV